MRELILLILLLSIAQRTRATTCPSTDTLYPCICNSTSSQLICGNSIRSDLTLKQIFQESSRQSSEQLLYQKFVLQNSIIETILSDTFDKFSFRELSIERNDYLKHIDENAFRSTFNITDKVVFEMNPSFGSNVKNIKSFFNLLSKFTNASLIHVIDCGLQYIPDNAFHPIYGIQSRLQRLSLSKNRIKNIGDFAFNNLPNINFLSISENVIEKLGKLSLSLSDNSNAIHIDLSKNKLTSNSFDSTSLSSIGRPFNLQLSDNNITYLNEIIFKPLFKRSIIIKLWRNPIKCDDCLMRWTSIEKHCEISNNTISYAQRIEFECKLFKENFRKCQNETYGELLENTLSCPLTSLSPNTTSNLIIICLIIIFAAIMPSFLSN